MPLNLKLIKYSSLNSRQKENYNYQKLSALLADYGFVTMRLSADWKGADLIAQHIDGDTFLIQLKSRLTFCEKYRGKGLYTAFRRRNDWYLYPHDEILKKVDAVVKFSATLSWTKGGVFSCKTPTKVMFQILNPYQIEPSRNIQRKLKLDDDP